jgi:uncharacterized protein YaiL (DUF2058 family)
MAISLQDQLLKAGLVDEKKVKQAKKAKRKKDKLQRKGQAQETDQARLEREAALKAQAEKDRLLNLERKQEVDRKALSAQIRQLIEMNCQTPEEGNVPYNFTHRNKIKKIFVDEKRQRQLGKGLLAIVEIDGCFELVPSAVAEKIRLRDESRVVLCNERTIESDEDDPYAEYQVPDDLMW